MKTKTIKIITIIIAAFVATFIPMAAPVFAENECLSDICSPACQVPEEVKAANGCGSTIQKVDDVVIKILNIIIGSLGIVAVIFVLIGGIGYMTSAGDTQKLKKARDTILYACIGLVICALSFAIVNFVIINVINK